MLKWIFLTTVFFMAEYAKGQLAAGKSLIAEGLLSWKPFGFEANDPMIKLVDVRSQPFKKAIQVNTFNRQTLSGNVGLNTSIITSLHKGDVLLVSFQARSLESKRETGESFVELRFDQLVNGKYLWPPYLERGVSIGNEWSETSVPFVMTKDVQPEDVNLVLRFDSYPQRFEIGPVSFLNYGPNVNLADLHRSVIHYDGDKPDAAWRKDVNDRIEKYRKGDLSIKVLDVNGKPIPGASVGIHMKRIAFNWGTSTSSQRILDSTGQDSKTYRDTLLKYFNQVVLENEMKAKNWEKANHEQTLQGIKWFTQHDIKVRGHVMVWPSWKNSPNLAKFKNDTAGLRAAIFKGVGQQTSLMKNKFVEWDVINEPISNHDFIDLLGRQEMVTWFKHAREGAPGVKLFLNDFTMFHGKGANSASEQFYNNAKFLLDNHAGIDAIGEQGHIGGTPPGIPYVIERLNYFQTLGLPIQISEFDINSNDDEFKARYLGDFMKAMFASPAVMGFVQWGFWEGQHWFPVAALWDKNWNIRAHGKIFTELVCKTWATNETKLTDDEGVCKTRAFNGQYEITIQAGNKKVIKQTVVTSNGAVLTVTCSKNTPPSQIMLIARCASIVLRI